MWHVTSFVPGMAERPPLDQSLGCATRSVVASPAARCGCCATDSSRLDLAMAAAIQGPVKNESMIFI